MKTKVSTPRSFLSTASRSVSTLGLIAVFACGAAAQQWTGPDASNNISNANSGNVGIGTAGPGSKLEINLAGTEGSGLNVLSGASNKYALIQWGRTSAEGTLAISRSAGAFFANSVPGDAWFGSTNGTIAFGDQTAGTASLIVKSGNVGIGTSNPSGNLHVEGSGQNNTLRIISTNSTSGGFVGQNTHANAQTVGYFENNRGGFTSYGGFLYGGSNNANGNLFGVSRADKMFLFADGASNLGIAVGTLGAQPLILGTSNTERIRVDSSGNVGIGTSTPGMGGYGQPKLDVVGRVRVRASDASLTPGIWLNDSPSASGSADQAFVGRSISATSGFWNSTGWALNVHDNGKVGIGTMNPDEKLHVAGSIKVDGNINAKYQDLAEWVPSSEQLAAGTVVVLDTTKSNQVIASTVGYDTRVAGVISAQPGITLGESGEGKVLVATTGRVRVKVDASRGPIQIGDLLVTSDMSGVAMKSEAVNLGGVQIHRPGTIIGKALEPLAKGSGEILVLLSLQ